MNKYILKRKSTKRILWGDFDSDFFFNDIKDYIEKEKDPLSDIELDFEGIKSMDYSFINDVFIKLLEGFGKNNPTTFIFNNIENDAIIYYLNQSFIKNNFVASIKSKNKIISIGSDSCILEST
jgi:hypothetical protein